MSANGFFFVAPLMVNFQFPSQIYAFSIFNVIVSRFLWPIKSRGTFLEVQFHAELFNAYITFLFSYVYAWGYVCALWWVHCMFFSFLNKWFEYGHFFPLNYPMMCRHLKQNPTLASTYSIISPSSILDFPIIGKMVGKTSWDRGPLNNQPPYIHLIVNQLTRKGG